MSERLSWLLEATEQLSGKAQDEILEEINKHPNDPLGMKHYVEEYYGRRAVEQMIIIANTEKRFDDSIKEDCETFLTRYLLEYAINRAVFREITETQCYSSIIGQTEASGTVSIAMFTQNGSMVFADPDSFKDKGQIVYIPIYGREIDFVSGIGSILSTRIDCRMLTISEGRGLIPSIGDQLNIHGVPELRWTSPLEEVKVKYKL